jgi:hypothetical protein
MLDDLRNSANSPFLEDGGFEPEAQEEQEQSQATFLGMTAVQRFVVSLLLFFMILILGGFMLILFQKVFPPI